MRKKSNGAGAVSYARALKICQNLAEITAYEVLGDQILHPADEGPSSPTESLVLMPGIQLTSDKMAEGIARLGMSALGVRAVQAPSGDYIADFTVLFATGGNAERYEDMRAWLHRDEGLYLIPSDTGATGQRFSSPVGCARSQIRGQTKRTACAGSAKQQRCFWGRAPKRGAADPSMKNSSA